MKNIVGLKVNDHEKIYWCDPRYFTLKVGDICIAELEDGKIYGKVVSIKNVDEKALKLNFKFKRVVRIATKRDELINRENIEREKRSTKIILERIKEHNLDMKVQELEFRFDGMKALCYFTSSGRVDFRELVKDAASSLRARIEFVQISEREEIRKLNCYGTCGLKCCCTNFLNKWANVNMKMVKEEGLAANTSKLTGVCGRFKCCVKYEYETYVEKNKKLPTVHSIVRTEDGTGEVVSVETLIESVKVKIKKDDSYVYKTFNAKDISIIKLAEVSEKY